MIINHHTVINRRIPNWGKYSVEDRDPFVEVIRGFMSIKEFFKDFRMNYRFYFMVVSIGH